MSNLRSSSGVLTFLLNLAICRSSRSFNLFCRNFISPIRLWASSYNLSYAFFLRSFLGFGGGASLIFSTMLAISASVNLSFSFSINMLHFCSSAAMSVSSRSISFSCSSHFNCNLEKSSSGTPTCFTTFCFGFLSSPPSLSPFISKLASFSCSLNLSSSFCNSPTSFSCCVVAFLSFFSNSASIAANSSAVGLESPSFDPLSFRPRLLSSFSISFISASVSFNAFSRASLAARSSFSTCIACNNNFLESCSSSATPSCICLNLSTSLVLNLSSFSK
mmetsp:Transcript_53514/g.85100  ORF Transcript_53514/g.85100 Transcript_53514/m.85100 type:complete len:276 (-) Transcript_53514:673-1500(-)